MKPIQIPPSWHEHRINMVDEFCDVLQVPTSIVRERQRRGAGPRCTKLTDSGALYPTAGQVRRLLRESGPLRAALDAARQDGGR